MPGILAAQSLPAMHCLSFEAALSQSVSLRGCVTLTGDEGLSFC